MQIVPTHRSAQAPIGLHLALSRPMHSWHAGHNMHQESERPQYLGRTFTCVSPPLLLRDATSPVRASLTQTKRGMDEWMARRRWKDSGQRRKPRAPGSSRRQRTRNSSVSLAHVNDRRRHPSILTGVRLLVAPNADPAGVIPRSIGRLVRRRPADDTSPFWSASALFSKQVVRSLPAEQERHGRSVLSLGSRTLDPGVDPGR